MRRTLPLLAFVVILAALPLPARGQPAAPELQVLPAGDGVRLRFAAGPGLASAEPPSPSTVALLLPPTGDAAPRLLAEERWPWGGPSPEQGPPARELPDGTRAEPLPGFARPAPAAPVELLYEARARGQRIGVYAVNPVYQAAGESFLVSSFEVLVPGAAPLGDPAALLNRDPDAPFLAAEPPGPNPLAARPGWTVRVAEGGMQTLGAAALRAAGLDPAAVDVSRLRLTRAGREVALEELRAGGELVELRFYAPPPASRWDPAAAYRLTVESAAGLRITPADARPVGAPASSFALARGDWYAPRSYESRLPGPDGDHFFSADLRPGVLPETTPATVTVRIAPPLPPATGPVTLTVSGASLYPGAHALDVSMAGTTRRATWSGRDAFSHRLSFPRSAPGALLSMPPAAAPDGAHIDRVAWELPVSLSFGGRGAIFYGREGRWAYRLSGLPAGAALYDLTNPAQPRRLTTAPAADGAAFEGQGPGPFLLTGPGSVRAPQIARHIQADLSRPLDATALYIAPRAWLATLEPLLARRRGEGLRVAAVPVEAIYAGWSGGDVDPAAIRAFLRYAAAAWATKPASVTLVGDGTSDPRNYFGRNQTNWLPPYLLPVDPWLGETACESCFVQLDGASPLDDLMPDLAIGRLPAKSATELAGLVRKIVGYESDPSPGRWRGRVAYIADDPDAAGDFAAVSVASASGHPDGVETVNVFYDPRAAAGDPSREPDPVRALDRTLAALGNAGAIVYFGHGLQYQWALTGPPAPANRRFLLGVDLAAGATNGGRLPVALSMTCLAGAFQTPNFRGTTLDEALVVNPNGGSIATWGSAGFGVLFGHETLTNGFFDALWQRPADARLGRLTMAGYARLAASGREPEGLRTFVLLGDPLTPLRMIPDPASVTELSLPLLRR